MPSPPGAQARAERAEARDVLDVVHLLVNLVLVLELHPVGLVIEGDALADVEQAVPVAARRTVQLLHPQAAADRVVDRAEALPPFNVGGHAHAVVVVVGVAVGLRAQYVAGVAVRVVLGGEAQPRGAAGQALRGAAIGIDEEDLAAIAAAGDRLAADVFRRRGSGAVIADLRQAATEALKPLPPSKAARR
ncbi:hypothetical protein G6F59_014753 [Rhizopus arrhizus]|nr:hypothetical protein G6F59_014753 [Rhizopus arrhizus]